VFRITFWELLYRSFFTPTALKSLYKVLTEVMLIISSVSASSFTETGSGYRLG
jgi:hypothetical protein